MDRHTFAGRTYYKFEKKVRAFFPKAWDRALHLRHLTEEDSYRTADKRKKHATEFVTEVLPQLPPYLFFKETTRIILRDLMPEIMQNTSLTTAQKDKLWEMTAYVRPEWGAFAIESSLKNVQAGEKDVLAIHQKWATVVYCMGKAPEEMTSSDEFLKSIYRASMEKKDAVWFDESRIASLRADIKKAYPDFALMIAPISVGRHQEMAHQKEMEREARS